MKIVLRGIGGLMKVHAALYLARRPFSVIYDNTRRVWDVMNVLSRPGMLIALEATAAGCADSQPARPPL